MLKLCLFLQMSSERSIQLSIILILKQRNLSLFWAILQILMDLVTALQNLHCQELKTPLPIGTGRLYPADWLLESLLWLREAECKHSYKSHLNNCCTGKREAAQLPRVSRALSAGTVHLSQVPNQLIWLLQKTLHRVPERGRGKKNWREKKAMDRTGYSGTKQNI